MRLQEACNCLPWFLFGKLEGNARSRLCERYGNRCFRNIVEHRNEEKDEYCADQCLPDCERTEYSWKVKW